MQVLVKNSWLRVVKVPEGIASLEVDQTIHVFMIHSKQSATYAFTTLFFGKFLKNMMVILLC